MTSVLVSVKTAASMCEVSEDVIRGAINKQQLPAVRVGRVIRIKPADVEAWADSLVRVGSEDDQ